MDQTKSGRVPTPSIRGEGVRSASITEDLGGLELTPQKPEVPKYCAHTLGDSYKEPATLSYPVGETTSTNTPPVLGREGSLPLPNKDAPGIPHRLVYTNPTDYPFRTWTVCYANGPRVGARSTFEVQYESALKLIELLNDEQRSGATRALAAAKLLRMLPTDTQLNIKIARICSNDLTHRYPLLILSACDNALRYASDRVTESTALKYMSEAGGKLSTSSEAVLLKLTASIIKSAKSRAKDTKFVHQPSSTCSLSNVTFIHRKTNTYRHQLPYDFIQVLVSNLFLEASQADESPDWLATALLIVHIYYTSPKPDNHGRDARATLQSLEKQVSAACREFKEAADESVSLTGVKRVQMMEDVSAAIPNGFNATRTAPLNINEPSDPTDPVGDVPAPATSFEVPDREELAQRTYKTWRSAITNRSKLNWLERVYKFEKFTGPMSLLKVILLVLTVLVGVVAYKMLQFHSRHNEIHQFAMSSWFNALITLFIEPNNCIAQVELKYPFVYFRAVLDKWFWGWQLVRLLYELARQLLNLCWNQRLLLPTSWNTDDDPMLTAMWWRLKEIYSCQRLEVIAYTLELVVFISLLSFFYWLYKQIVEFEGIKMSILRHLPVLPEDSADSRPTDMNLDNVQFTNGFAIVHVEHYRHYLLLGYAFKRLYREYDIKMNIERFKHLTSPRNLSDDPEVTRVRLLTALRSQTAHNTSRGDTVNGSEPVTLNLIRSWYDAMLAAGGSMNFMAALVACIGEWGIDQGVPAALPVNVGIIQPQVPVQPQLPPPIIPTSNWTALPRAFGLLVTQHFHIGMTTLPNLSWFFYLLMTCTLVLVEEMIKHHPDEIIFTFAMFLFCVIEPLFTLVSSRLNNQSWAVSITNAVWISLKHFVTLLMPFTPALTIHLINNVLTLLSRYEFNRQMQNVLRGQQPDWLPSRAISLSSLVLWMIVLPSSPWVGLFLPTGRLSILETVASLYGYGVQDVPHKKLPKAPMPMNINYNRQEADTRPISVKIGPTCSQYASPSPALNEPFGPVEALHHRLSIAPGQLNRQQLDSLRQTSYWLISKLVRSGAVKPLNANSNPDFEDWLAHTHYTEGRKEQLRQAHEKAMNGRLPFSKTGRVKCFIKNEFYEKYKPHRAINARSDKAKVIMGPLFHLIEKQVFKLLYFIKTVPMDQRAVYMRELFGYEITDNIVLLESDFSKMESHFTARMKDALEWPLYDVMTRSAPQLRPLLQEIVKTLGGRSTLYFRNGEVTSSCKAKRLSGEMNTSLGNGWSTLVLIHHIDYLLTGQRVLIKGVFEGDDGLTQVNVARWGGIPDENWVFQNTGFRMTLEVRNNVDESLFCGTMQAQGSNHTLYDPKKFLRNFGWSGATHINFGPEKRKQLIRVKALSYRYMFPTCPVIRAVTDRVLHLTKNVSITTKFLNAHLDNYSREKFLLNVQGRYSTDPTTMAERELVEKQFGMSIEEQLRIEKKCRSWTLDTWFEVAYDDHPDCAHFLNKYLGTTTKAPLDRPHVWPTAYSSYSYGPPPIYWLHAQPELSFVAIVLAVTLRLSRKATTNHKDKTAKPCTFLMNVNRQNNKRKNPTSKPTPKRTATAKKEQARARIDSKRRQLQALTSPASTSRPRVPQRTGRPQRGGGLARLGNRTSQRMGSSNSRAAPRVSNAPPLKSIYRKDPSKPPVIAARRHTSLDSYLKATRKAALNSKAPLAEQSQLHGAKFDEYEFMQDGNRHMRLSGREFLTPIGNPAAVTVSNAPTGYRFAIIPLSPAALGGRLALMAEQFEYSKGRKFRLVYEPVVPATQSGALAMYFNNDIGTPVCETGDDELAHASTHEYFAQTAFWSECFLDIKPEDAISHYVDQESGEARFEVQGLIVLELASPMALPASFTFGNLYLEYEVEFSVESLDYSVQMREEAVMTVATAAGTPTGGSILQFTSAAASASTPQFTVTPPNGASTLTLEDWMFVATCVHTAAEFDGGNNDFHIEGESSVYLWLGSGLIFRFSSNLTTTWARPYSTMTAASDANFPQGATNPRVGQLIWPTTLIPFTANPAALIIRGYWHPISPDVGA